jgi:hypothetical protein
MNEVSVAIGHPSLEKGKEISLTMAGVPVRTDESFSSGKTNAFTNRLIIGTGA